MQNAYFDAPEIPTITGFGSRYLKDYCTQKDSFYDDFRRINKKVLPAIGHLRLTEVRRLHIYQLHSSMRHTPYEANRTLELLQRMFEVAIEWEVLPPPHANPARKVEPHPEYPRDVYVKEDQMPRVLARINELKDNKIRVAILMLLATGCRQKEMLSLKWSEVDFKAGQIHIRRRNTKTELDYLIPITPYIEELLTSLQRENQYVFASRSSSKGHLQSVSGTWHSIRRDADIPEVQLRDLRSTAATWCANDNVSLYTIQKLLNHTTPRCTQRYAKTQNLPVRLALERYHENLNAP